MTDDTPSPASGPYADLIDFVWRRVGALHRGLAHSSTGAAADLAHLRTSVGSDAASDPRVWRIVYTDFPPAFLGRGDAASPAESAVHATLGLFAVHQQSRSESMHRRGVGFGRAAQRLATDSGSDAAVRRRFEAVATAVDLREVLHHARGLVTQMSARRIPLDYGLLASDLIQLQNPERRSAVLRRWGREYYTRPDPTTPTDEHSSTTTSADTSLENGTDQ
ncbi:type I-E CRISPR-associated protein Cse2/CasB [Galbitalea sp. SE-J8]|uniref:type I-E CRISPR-associated protein Cse2/CasB n=1 Tax=Galbitalea sp. SE-J8 TaxID=3054952 RepID=UPI00259C88F1|nr:type I-E CRISPR-associated protein Cse2/CasB [Galbitalea sp. SE-J8]MDM4762831.1 type I-E CRISPR-associated protein Cse2/CasB [Galbitalea sp. SE-J8]